MKLFFLSMPFMLLIVFPLTSIADKAASSNKKGIESYSQKNYEESVKHFTDALIERPNSPELRYNLGTALSEIGEKKDEALKELSIAAETTDNPELSASAHYNMGNKLLLSGDLEKSINEYKKALKLDQNSKDIRYNLELAIKKLQHQQQQRKKEENQDGKKKEENTDTKQNTQHDDNKEKTDHEQNNNQQSNPENSDNERPQDQQQQLSSQQNSENQPMTEEEAQRILDAINNEEKKALSLRRMQIQTEMKQGDDW